MSSLRVGVAGCGRWGTRIAERLSRLADVCVVAAYDHERANAEKLAAVYSGRVHDTAEGLAQDSAVDAIVIVTPHSTHEAIALAASVGGKHIFCEKPLAIDTAACLRMISAAERHGVKLMCGHVTRLFPIYDEVARLVAANAVGTISAFSLGNLVHIDRVGWWARSEMMGALLHSPGVHFIDVMRHVGGEVVGVQAMASAIRVQQSVDYADSVFMLLRFDGGAIGSLQCSVSSLSPGTAGHIIGTDGTLTFDARHNRIDVASWNGSKVTQSVTPTERESQIDLGLDRELSSFVDWIRTDAPPLLTAEDGLRAVEIVQAAYRSVRTGQEVLISEVQAGGASS